MRAELLGRVAAAQFDLDNALAELARSGSATGSARDQLQALTRLQRQIGAADLASLTVLRGDVTAAIAATQALAREARIVTAEAATADALGLTGAGNASRAEVTAVMQSMHRFDPYLRFTSPEDEATYRQRETERLAYIAAEQAKHTPQGDLNASAGAIGQMVDVKAHGGGDSPEFQHRWNALVATTERLRDAVRASGGSTAEFDDHLREDLRRILRAKGLSDAQIDAQFAAHPDPLEAAKAFVADRTVSFGDRDIEAVRANAKRAVDSAAATPSDGAREQSTPPPSVTQPDSLEGAVADLRALGIVVTDHGTAPPTHGVATNATSADRSKGVS